VGNMPTAPTFLWTFVSILVMLGGIGGLVWYTAVVTARSRPRSCPTPTRSSRSSRRLR
jgi:hypothetical protein